MIPVQDKSTNPLEPLLEALAEKVAERLARERGRISTGVTRATRLLTLKEAATYLALSLSTIKKMLISSELKIVTRGGRRMIDLQDLDQWIEQHKK